MDRLRGGGGASRFGIAKSRAVAKTLAAHTDSVYSVAFNSDGKHLASIGADQKVKVWDLTVGKVVFTRPSEAAEHNRGTAYGVTFSPDGRLLAVGNRGAVEVSGLVERINCYSRSQVTRRKGSVWRLATTDAPGVGELERRCHDLGRATGELLHTLSEHHHPVSAPAFSPDGQRLVSASFDRSLIVWDATNGQRSHARRTRRARPWRRLQPRWFRLASAGEDKTVRVWEAATGREILDLRVHDARIAGCGI